MVEQTRQPAVRWCGTHYRVARNSFFDSSNPTISGVPSLAAGVCGLGPRHCPRPFGRTGSASPVSGFSPASPVRECCCFFPAAGFCAAFHWPARDAVAETDTCDILLGVRTTPTRVADMRFWHGQKREEIHVCSAVRISPPQLSIPHVFRPRQGPSHSLGIPCYAYPCAPRAKTCFATLICARCCTAGAGASSMGRVKAWSFALSRHVSAPNPLHVLPPVPKKSTALGEHTAAGASRERRLRGSRPLQLLLELQTPGAQRGAASDTPARPVVWMPAGTTLSA